MTNEIEQLVNTLKARLKSQGMTYRDVALALNISEASVKRLFASQRFTLDRLIEVSHLLGFTLAELAHEAALGERRVHLLSVAQETQLVADERFLLVAVCVLNQWSVAEITHIYQFTEAQCITFLLKLDRLRLIQLLPGNRIRLNIARDFDWLPKGPIRQYFMSQGLDEFLHGGFAQSGEMMSFSHAMLSDAALAKMQLEMRRLRKKFAELHEESLSQPLDKRHGTGLLLALREWELSAFTKLRRQ